MRKSLLSSSTNDLVFPQASESIPQLAPATSPATAAPPSLISFPPLSSSSSPSPSPFAASDPQLLFFFPKIPSDSAFDIASLSLIAGLLLLCVLSFSTIFYFCLRSRRWHHLQHFNSLWTTRLLLVSLASLWVLNELHRLSLFRREYILPFLPPLSLDQQANLCKVHQVLSLGFFEPGFLVTLLFLVNVSIRKRVPRRMCALATVCLACSPVLALQTLFVFFSPLQTWLPQVVHGSFLRFTDQHGKTVVLCKYPLISSLVFGGFVVAYLLAFLLSSWKVVAFVINKNIRARINILSATVMIALPSELLCLALSALWVPSDPAYSSAVFAMFLCVALVVAVGEVILVIVPITEALTAGGHSCPWRPSMRMSMSISLRQSDVDT